MRITLFNKVINMSTPAQSITNCDTKKFFNRANFILLSHILRLWHWMQSSQTNNVR